MRELKDLQQFIAEVLGWQKGANSSPTWWFRGSEVYCVADGSAPNYLADYGRMEETKRWLNKRDYLVVTKQIPRGRGFLFDEITGERTPPDLPAYAELDYVGNYQTREYRLMQYASIEHQDIDSKMFWQRIRALGSTEPETICRLIEQVLEHFPNLRDLPTKGTNENAEYPA